MKWVEKEINGWLEAAYVPTETEFISFIKTMNELGYEDIEAIDYCSWIGIDYYAHKSIYNTQLTVEDINKMVKEECEALGIKSLSINIWEDGISLSIHARVLDSCFYRERLFKENGVKYRKSKCKC